MLSPYKLYNHLNYLNNLIVHNEQIKDLVPQIINVAEIVKITKKTKNISKTIQICLQSSQYQNTLTKLKSLTINFNENETFNRSLPPNKIYFNPLSIQEGSHSIAVIIIPKGLQFSLHDHTQMLVLTKLLFGQLEVQSMDIDEDYLRLANSLRLDNLTDSSKFNKKSLNKNKRTADEKKNSLQFFHSLYEGPFNNFLQKYKNYSTFCQSNMLKTKNWKKNLLTESNLEVLTPTSGNIHRLYAKTDCILLDILLPDYANEQHCSYYEYSRGSSHSDNPIIYKVKQPKQAPFLQDLSLFLSMENEKQGRQEVKI